MERSNVIISPTAVLSKGNPLAIDDVVKKKKAFHWNVCHRVVRNGRKGNQRYLNGEIPDGSCYAYDTHELASSRSTVAYRNI